MIPYLISISLWLVAVILWAFLIEPYKQMKPIDRIKQGFLLWNENFHFNRNRLRLDIHFVGLFRYWVSGPVGFKDQTKRANRVLRDLEQIDPHAFHLAKKAGKLRL